jgi:hypothetical protein
VLTAEKPFRAVNLRSPPFLLADDEGSPQLPDLSNAGILRCHENGRAEGTLECPSADGHSKALRAFSCTVVSERIMKSSLRTTGMWPLSAACLDYKVFQNPSPKGAS